jgi:hypothetical protein
VSLRRLAFHRPMCSGGDTRALPRVGSPIRKSAGHRLFSTSPRLIAAIHVLHRLLTPRHPPRALSILTRYLEHTYCRYAVFKVRARPARGAGWRDRGPPRPVLPVGRSLKTEQHSGAPRFPHATNPSSFVGACGRCPPGQVVDIVLGHRSPGVAGGARRRPHGAPEPWWC